MLHQPELSEARQKVHKPVWLRSLENRNFRLLWMGETVSLFGDQFYIIALPWLVFQMTGSSLAFGTILMVAGIPRAVFMLVGGVVTDRFSPRAVMVTSNLLRFVITVVLTIIIAGQEVHLWMLYVVAFCFGLADAFFHPAYRAMIPLIVDKEYLQPSNSLMLGASHLVQTAGPGVAGVVVRSLGVALSFAFDALTFLLSAILLLLMRPTALPEKHSQTEQHGIVAQIGEMLAFVRRDPILPTIVTVIAAINFLFTGPLIVGTATLGRVRFVEGSAAYGAMLSAFGAGVLIGMLSAGVIRAKRPGFISLLLVAAQGVLLVGIAYTSTLIAACVLLTVIGVGAGFGNITVVTMTQKRVTADMMGRFMSLVVLAEVGLTPISNAVAGVLADLNVTALFVIFGVLLTLTALAALQNPEIRKGEV